MHPPREGGTARSLVAPEAQRVLEALPGIVAVGGPDDRVLWSSTPAGAAGLVVAERFSVPEVSATVGQVRQDGVTREVEVSVPPRPLRTAAHRLRVRVAPLSARTTLVLAEDVSAEQRLDAVRRDFVANVSHELKTPVGALALLAEAAEAAEDDPAQVARFVARMQGEARRLTSLIEDLIDLSRLEGASGPTRPAPVAVPDVVAEAVEATRLLAQAQQIELVVAAVAAVEVLGDERQLVTALRNLLVNAISYSPAQTRVVVTGRLTAGGDGPGLVEVDVSDQGIGIDPDEQDRIFERFYRIDPARSRQTGGTGLGLSIVKHVSVNHGGECLVRSVPGEGSTFTLRLPVLTALGATAQVEQDG